MTDPALTPERIAYLVQSMNTFDQAIRADPPDLATAGKVLADLDKTLGPLSSAPKQKDIP